MEYGEKLFFDVKEVTKQVLESQHKNRFAVTNDRIKEIIVLHHYIDNNFYKSESINNNFNWLIIYYFSQMVNNNKNLVIVVAFPITKQ